MTNLLNFKLKTLHIILIASSFGLLLTVLLGFIFYTPLLKAAVKSQKALKPGNEMRDFYLKLPIPLDFRVYFFNITNPEEVKEGAKPILLEVGPYCYDAYKEKIVVDEDEGRDTLTYTPYDTYFFNQTRSGKLSEDDFVTILNPLIVGIINAVANQKPRYLSAINKALPIIFKESYGLYQTVKVKDILFDGIQIDCNVRDFTASAVCGQFKLQPAIKEIDNDVFSFSLFGARNGTIAKQITVKRGIKNAEDIGRVIAIDNKTNLEVWPEDQCNEFHGTDGWIFPSFLAEDDGIWTVSSDMCRSFKARFVGNERVLGLSVRKYHADLGDMSSNPEEKCFCPTPESCLPKGVLDMSKCMKVPILCTLPHFLLADQKLLEQVEGLHPDIDKHIIKIYFEPIIGTPVIGTRRMQFNLQLEPIGKVAIMRNVSELLHPIMWLEEGVELDGYLLKRITSSVTLLKVMNGFRFLSLVVSLDLIIYCCYKFYKEWRAAKIIPMDTQAERKNEVNLTLGRQGTEKSEVNTKL